MRRIFHEEELYETPEEFIDEWVERLSNEEEYILYFGVYNKRIGYPCKPNPSKILRILCV